MITSQYLTQVLVFYCSSFPLNKEVYALKKVNCLYVSECVQLLWKLHIVSIIFTLDFSLFEAEQPFCKWKCQLEMCILVHKVSWVLHIFYACTTRMTTDSLYHQLLCLSLCLLPKGDSFWLSWKSTHLLLGNIFLLHKL